MCVSVIINFITRFAWQRGFTKKKKMGLQISEMWSKIYLNMIFSAYGSVVCLNSTIIQESKVIKSYNAKMLYF